MGTIPPTISLFYCLVIALTAPLSLKSIHIQQSCAGIKGRVTTEDGAVISRADIGILNNETKQRQKTQTNGEGEYSMCLSPGRYDIIAETVSFKPTKRKAIKVEASAKSIVDFVLKRGKPVITDEKHP